MEKLAQNFRGGDHHRGSLCDVAYAVNAISHRTFGDYAEMDPQELIKKLIEATGLKDGPLAKAINHSKVTQPQLHKLRHGTIKEPKDDLLRPIAAYFGLNCTAPFRDPELAQMTYEILFDKNGNYQRGRFANVVVTDPQKVAETIFHGRVNGGDPIREALAVITAHMKGTNKLARANAKNALIHLADNIDEPAEVEIAVDQFAAAISTKQHAA